VANTQAVLGIVNAGRVAAGGYPLDDLPQGYRGKADSCPLAYAFKDVLPEATVGVSKVTFRRRERAAAFASAIGGKISDINGKATVVLPYELQKFVSEFDAGYFPKYDKLSASRY
jgi:hypothetical protein